MAYANIVLILEIAGLFSALNQATVLALQFSLTGISALVWVRAGRPNLLGPLSGFSIKQFLKMEMSPFLRNNPLIVFLAICVGYIYLRHIFLILVLHFFVFSHF